MTGTNVVTPDDIDDYLDDWQDDDDYDRDDLDDCGLWAQGGAYTCEDVGSEACDFECPWSDLIGKACDADGVEL